jgi:hypothetical protein
VSEAPSNLQVLDESFWEGYAFTNRTRLRWQPGKGLIHVLVRGTKLIPGPAMNWNWEERLDATATNVEVPVRLYERWQFSVQGVNRQHDVFVSQYQTVDIKAPNPKPPINLSAKIFSENKVAIAWRGDNITDSFELERLQWPSQADKVNPQIAKNLSAAGGTAGPPASAAQKIPSSGISAGARLGGAPTNPGGGNVTAPSPHSAPPAIANGQGPSTSKIAPQPVWVTVQRGIPTWENIRDGSVVDEISKPSPALGGSIYQPYTYRICAVNRTGRTCWASIEAKGPSVNQGLSTDRFPGR